MTEAQPSPKKKEPFKLCFAPKNLMGHSDIQIGKPLVLPPVMITPKFYSRHESRQEYKGELQKQLEYLNVLEPRKKYKDAITENQRYGWYQEKFTDLDRSDRRLHFAKQTNPIVMEHLMNYENIR